MTSPSDTLETPRLDRGKDQAAPPSFLANAVRSGSAAAGFVAAGYLLLHVISLVASPLLSSFANDEYINYYLAARNFNTYGFAASTFLQDFSTSSSPDEHPFVYDHMAAGPEITTALLTRVAGENYRAVRFFFAAWFLIGLYCYFRVASMLFAGLGLGGAGYALLLLDPLAVMHVIDHPGHASFPFFAFYPLLALNAWRETGKHRFLAAACAAVMASTFFLAYQLVVLNMVGCCMLWILQLLPLKKLDLAAVLLAMTVGVGLHVGQNVWHLGLSVAIRELALTFSNRATGYPTGPDLVAFYQSINVVHHGVHTLRPTGLLITFLHCVNFRVIKGLFVIALAFLVGKAVLWAVERGTRTPDQSPAPRGPIVLVKLAGWVLPSILMPLLLFPAYSVDYNLQGNGHFFGALLGLGVVLVVYQNLLATSRSPMTSKLALGLLGLAVVPFMVRQGSGVHDAYVKASADKFRNLNQIQKNASQKVTMTNMYPAVVGFFTHEKVFGVAEMESFPNEHPPDPNAAYSKFIVNWQPSTDCRPSHYIHSRDLPGFGKSVNREYNERLRAHIAARHRIIYEDNQLTIFELIW